MPNSKTLPTSHTIKEAAPIVGVSEPTLRAMVRSGRLHAYKVGTGGPKSQWRITTAELERFMGEASTNA